MKIGILTFHFAHNYGAVLQAYALKEVLKSMGHSVEVIDYLPDYFFNKYNPFSVKKSSFYSFARSLLGKCKILPTFFLHIKRYLGFKNFINKYLNPVKIDLESSDHGFDVFIFGSDQIWNPNITNRGFDKVYFGDFAGSLGKKNVAYAASAGGYKFTCDDVKKIEDLLSRFYKISVREESLKNIILKLRPGSVEQVLDPVLLANSENFKSITHSSIKMKKYVLVYQVVEDPKTMRIAKHIAKQFGCDVIELTARISFSLSTSKDQSAAPQKFVSYFNNAEYVVTTSFHGTVFSILFGRPFYVVGLNPEHDNRSKSLLTSLGLENRLVDKHSLPEVSNIDYRLVNNRLEELRMNSCSFLVGAIDG